MGALTIKDALMELLKPIPLVWERRALKIHLTGRL
jgi:hypothetical protein